MNYYSIEFFKHYLKLAMRNCNSNELEDLIKKMLEYVKDREQNNKSAYLTKWMKKPVFK
jgi:hypothetical protein